MSLVIDLNSVCLVCFQDNGGELHEVFSSDEETPQFTIAEKITLCSDLQLETANNKLPDKICARCINDLAAAWRFRQNCETAKTVFRSIQQQEEDAEALATFELECQKIKVPSGLKIKRIQPETKTFLLPVELNAKNEDVETAQEEHLEFQTIANDISEEGEEVRTEDAEEEVVTEENIELEDYYEAEEILEEDVEMVGQLEQVDTIKIERREETIEEEPNEILVKVKKEKTEEGGMKQTNNKIQEKFKRECDDIDADLEAESETQKHFVKRPRGRPRKSTQIEVNRSASTSPSSAKNIQIKTEKENLNEVITPDDNQSESDATSAPAKSKLSVKSFASDSVHANYLPVKTRKRRKSRNHPPKICEICGNTYKYQHALTAHMRRHTNDRPFSCEFCDKAFVSGVELRRHMRVHTGQKPYPCKFCERRFSDFGSRIKHERTHTGERPYRCKTCDKAFAYAHVLSVHLRTHTGEKKFQCSRCGKGFTKKAYLLSHMEQHARAASAEGYLGQQNHGINNEGEHVALEECIFTTEYIEEDEDAENFDGTVVELEEVAEEDIEEEEHLEETEPELILGVR